MRTGAIGDRGSTPIMSSARMRRGEMSERHAHCAQGESRALGGHAEAQLHARRKRQVVEAGGLKDQADKRIATRTTLLRQPSRLAVTALENQQPSI